MLDLNVVDSPSHILGFNIDYEEYIITKENVLDQIYNLQNLGIDLLKDYDDDIFKVEILKEVIAFVNDNYLNITDIDNIMISDEFILEFGYNIYLFLIIDCYNSIFPNFIKLSNITYVKSGNYDSIKQKLIKSVQLIIEPLLKLQKIDPSVNKDIKYKAFLKRVTYELDLLDYSDITDFVENYMRPVFQKYQNDLLWRAL